MHECATNKVSCINDALTGRCALQGDSLAASLLSGAEGTSVAAVRGLTVLADAALPPSLSLLPADLRASLPDRCSGTLLWMRQHHTGKRHSSHAKKCHHLSMPLEQIGYQTFSHMGASGRWLGWVCRLLSSASAMSGRLPPRQQAVMEGALNLAVRLGLPAEKLLQQLLHSEGSAQLYQTYHRAVSFLA